VNAAKQLFATLADERVFTANDVCQPGGRFVPRWCGGLLGTAGTSLLHRGAQLGTDGALMVAEARASYQKATVSLAAALREVAAVQRTISVEPSTAEVAQLRAEVAAAEEVRMDAFDADACEIAPARN